MFSSIYEVTYDGGDKLQLTIPQKEYFLTYEDLTEESAQDLVENYFKFTGRDGLPKVIDVDYNATRNNVEIVVDIKYNRDTKLEPASVPHSLADWRSR